MCIFFVIEPEEITKNQERVKAKLIGRKLCAVLSDQVKTIDFVRGLNRFRQKQILVQNLLKRIAKMTIQDEPVSETLIHDSNNHDLMIQMSRKQVIIEISSDSLQRQIQILSFILKDKRNKFVQYLQIHSYLNPHLNQMKDNLEIYHRRTIYFYVVSLILTMVFVRAHVTQVTQYPNSDEYFDRIFVLQNGVNSHYLRLYCKEKNMLSISITNSLQFQQYPRFSIHSPEFQTPRMQKKLYTFLNSCEVDYRVNEKGSIIKILKKGTEQIIFAINDYKMINQGDVQIYTEDYSTKWGMGQRFQKSFALKDGTWTIWNRDRPWEIDNGLGSKSAQTYGHQPVYLAKNIYSPDFHLVYFKNTFGMNIEVADNSKKIKYMATGGHVHFVVILGDHPERILQQYHNYIGAAMVPPFWALGYHQSRWGYRDYRQVAQVVDQFEKYGIPLEVMWSDLDYMERKMIFTVDKNKYPPQEMRNLLIKKRIHYIPLIDAGVSIEDRAAIDNGNKLGVFIKSLNSPGQNYLAAVWPGKVNFVDFLHPNSSNFWRSQLERLHSQIPFSGIWLDMNQPSNFQGNQPVIQQYRIQHVQSINMMTMNVNLNHFCKSCDYQLKHKQVHAYYGHLSTIPTYQFLKKKNGRPFIISRSNSVGTGVYAGHWTGDNVADWDFLRLSISGNFLFQIFGIQTVGADICGFHKNTNEQLCSRWMQVGSFYPFSRNHNENQSISQQPYRFGNKLLQTSKSSLNQRYSLLKQMYSTLVEVNGTGSFYRPLFFQFPKDAQTYIQKFAQTEFLIGDYLLGAPIVEQGIQQRQIYFPKDEQSDYWYQLQYRNGQGLSVNKEGRYIKGQSIVTIRNQLPSAPPTFLRSGRIIFVNQPAQRTADLTNHFTLISVLGNDRSRGNFLSANNFTNNTQIDACVEKGCLLEFFLYKAEDQNFILEWKTRGSANIEPDMVIQKILIVEEDRLYQPTNQIKIKKSEGRQILTVK